MYVTRGDKISIHALRKEGDGKDAQLTKAVEISIHALRKEGDMLVCGFVSR